MYGFGDAGFAVRGSSVHTIVRLAWALLLLARSVTGQAKEPELDLATAKQLFAEAAVLEARSDWAGAARKLRSALEIKDTPGLRYHLGHCQEQLGALVAASREYERAEELVRRGMSAPDVEQLLPLAQRRLDSRIARLDIVIPAGTSAVAEVDGRPLPSSALGTSLRLDPGAHHVLVRAAPHADYREDLVLATGEHRTLKVLFAEQPAPAEDAPIAPASSGAPTEPPPAATPKARDERSRSSVRTALLIGEAAVMLAGIGVGTGYAIARGRATADYEKAQDDLGAAVPDVPSACSSYARTGQPPECGPLEDAIDAHKRAVKGETIGFVTAGAAAGLFLATWAFWPASREKPRVSLSPLSNGASLIAAGSF